MEEKENPNSQSLRLPNENGYKFEKRWKLSTFLQTPTFFLTEKDPHVQEEVEEHPLKTFLQKPSIIQNYDTIQFHRTIIKDTYPGKIFKW